MVPDATTKSVRIPAPIILREGRPKLITVFFRQTPLQDSWNKVEILRQRADDLSGASRASRSSALKTRRSTSRGIRTGVADRVPAQIAHIVYLDAFVPEHGQAVLDLITPERQQVMEALVKAEGDGWLLPRFAPAPWETIVRDMWGVTDENDVRWMLDRLVPTPVGHLRDAAHRTNPVAEKLPRTYIRCRQFPNPRFDQHAEMARRNALWRYRELSSPHHPAVTMPDTVTDLLLELAS